MKKWLLALSFALLPVYAVATYFLSNMIVHGPPRRSIPEAYERLLVDWQINRDSMFQLLPTPEEVNFTGAGTIDDSNALITLKGWWFPANDTVPANCAVVMAHGITDNRSGMLPYTFAYRDCGCDLLLYDHRAHNESGGGDIITGGILEAQDLEAAHRYVAQRTNLPDNRIGWVGESWGGAAALIAGGNNTIRPAFIHVDSPYSDWYTAISERAEKMFGGWITILFPGTFFWVDQKLGLNHADASPQRAAANIQVPVLIIHSAADVETTPDQSQKIYDHLAHPELSQLHLLDWNSWHAQAAARRPAAYQEIVRGFLSEFAPDFCATEAGDEL